MSEGESEFELALLTARGRAAPPMSLARQVTDLSQAYRIQRRVAAAANLPVMVWKIGLTGTAGRAAFGAAEPAIGRLAASSIYSNASSILYQEPELYAEAELVFEMASDLPMQKDPYSRAQVAGALKAVYAGIEIVRTRFANSDLSLGQLVADNCMAEGLVLGRKLADGWEDHFADMPVTLLRQSGNGPGEIATGGTSLVMGNPLDALVWLANWLRANEGISLTREQLIASGTCTGATRIFAGDTVVVSFDGVDSAKVKLDR
ncbi:MAG: hypothetical protein ABIT10_02095 [Alteraurantiacibacter sp.]